MNLYIIKKPLILVSLSLFFVFNFQAQETHNISFFGSSVCNGTGAENNHGYAWQFYHRNVIDTFKFKYQNASTGGDNTIKVEKFDRLTNKLYPTDPQFAVIGLSLGNEGIRSPIDHDGREVIVEQFRSRLLALADSLRRNDIFPIIVNCYAHTLFKSGQYESTKKMNRIINTWDYPSINVLGTIDDLEGRWVEGFVRDPWHPNYEGHKEMSYAIVPSLFEAILQGKKIPKHDWNQSHHTLAHSEDNIKPIVFLVEEEIRSFSLSFRFKKTGEGSIAGFSANGTDHNIIVQGFQVKYGDLKIIFERHIDDWTNIVLAHSYANQLTTLFVNGQEVGRVKEQISPQQIYFGGSAQKIDLKDLCIYRAALNNSEARDLHQKKFIQSSLEFFNPLTRELSGLKLHNHAQSLSEMSIDSRLKIEFKKIDF